MQQNRAKTTVPITDKTGLQIRKLLDTGLKLLCFKEENQA